jgi:hypothetical protein
MLTLPLPHAARALAPTRSTAAVKQRNVEAQALRDRLATRNASVETPNNATLFRAGVTLKRLELLADAFDAAAADPSLQPAAAASLAALNAQIAERDPTAMMRTLVAQLVSHGAALAVPAEVAVGVFNTRQVSIRQVRAVVDAYDAAAADPSLQPAAVAALAALNAQIAERDPVALTGALVSQLAARVAVHGLAVMSSPTVMHSAGIKQSRLKAATAAFDAAAANPALLPAALTELEAIHTQVETRSGRSAMQSYIDQLAPFGAPLVVDARTLLKMSVTHARVRTLLSAFVAAGSVGAVATDVPAVTQRVR